MILFLIKKCLVLLEYHLFHDFDKTMFKETTSFFLPVSMSTPRGILRTAKAFGVSGGSFVFIPPCFCNSHCNIKFLYYFLINYKSRQLLLI